MSKPTDPGKKVVIVSGPSGAGKSTLLRTLIGECGVPLQFSISATTRRPRNGEQPDVHYHFLSLDEFQRRREAGEFLEYNEVFGRGEWYGTLRSEVTAGLDAGKWVVLEIDVEGAMSVLETYPQAVTFFVHPGSLEELERRLRDRKTESEESILRRLEVARREMEFIDKYRHQIVNDTIERAVEEMCRILKSLEEESQCSKN